MEGRKAGSRVERRNKGGRRGMEGASVAKHDEKEGGAIINKEAQNITVTQKKHM